MKEFPNSELLNFCDQFHMAKMLLKMTVLQAGEYDIEMAPFCGQFNNDLDLRIQTYAETIDEVRLREALVLLQGVLTPNVNSWRKTKGKEVAKVVKTEKGCLDLKNLLSPDINMYLVISSLHSIL